MSRDCKLEKPARQHAIAGTRLPATLPLVPMKIQQTLTEMSTGHAKHEFSFYPTTFMYSGYRKIMGIKVCQKKKRSGIHSNYVMFTSRSFLGSATLALSFLFGN